MAQDDGKTRPLARQAVGASLSQDISIESVLYWGVD
jgi:hypothetical protein